MPTRRPGRPPTGRAQSAAERMRRSRARQRAAGLRVATRWLPAASAAISPGVLKHRIIEARSLAMHCLIARKIEADRRLLAAARRNLAKWIARYGGGAPPAPPPWGGGPDPAPPGNAAPVTAPDGYAPPPSAASPLPRVRPRA